MRAFRQFRRPSFIVGAAVAATAAAAILLAPHAPGAAQAAPAPEPVRQPDSVDLTEAQARSLRVDPAALHNFARQRAAVGSIDFNENRSVQVFTPYAGKILQAFGDIGDEVPKGRTLFTIDSPDLVQAEAALIAAAGVFDLTHAALERARGLAGTQGIAQKDLEQAVSDEQTAEGALKAAREAVRVFGKSETEIDRVVASRRIDPALVVPAPVAGRITARMAQPGLLVQPGSAPAPYVISDVSSVWLLASVPESDSPLLKAGQPLQAGVAALPGRRFEGRVSTVGESVDPNLHTVTVRSEIRDPHHELRPGMLATFLIRTGEPLAAIGVPQNGVVREGDGTTSIWVTADRRHFTRRSVQIGQRQDGIDEVVAGLAAGELVVTDGAIFLSNLLVSAPDS
jgi:cobalt-zinc-cadmium efflux system membrane fusion protein